MSAFEKSGHYTAVSATLKITPNVLRRSVEITPPKADVRLEWLKRAAYDPKWTSPHIVVAVPISSTIRVVRVYALFIDAMWGS